MANGSRTPHPEVLPGDSVRVLDLSARVANCLEREGIRTVGDLVRRRREDLLRIAKFGRTSLCELVRRLAAHGLQLGSRFQAPRGAARASEMTLGECMRTQIAAGLAANSGLATWLGVVVRNGRAVDAYVDLVVDAANRITGAMLKDAEKAAAP